MEATRTETASPGRNAAAEYTQMSAAAESPDKFNKPAAKPTAKVASALKATKDQNSGRVARPEKTAYFRKAPMYQRMVEPPSRVDHQGAAGSSLRSTVPVRSIVYSPEPVFVTLWPSLVSIESIKPGHVAEPLKGARIKA